MNPLCGQTIIKVEEHFKNWFCKRGYPDQGWSKRSFVSFLTQVRNNQYRGDFLSLIGRNTNDGKLMSTISKHFDSSDE